MSLLQYFDKLLGDFPEENIEEIKAFKHFKSIRGLAKHFGLSFNKFRSTLIQYLKQKYDSKRAEIIYNKLWPTLKEKTKIIKQEFLKKFEFQLKNYFPKEIEKIDQRIDYAREFEVDPNTITNWTMEYLINKHSPSIKAEESLDYAQEVYNKIWKINLSISGGRQKINHNRIRKYIQSRHGKLITKEKEFDGLGDIISRRYVSIKCQEGHNWSVLVSNLLYRKSWCPSCRQLKCQEYLLLYMKAIFGKKFYQTTLTKAYGLRYEPREGMLKFDGFNESMLIEGKEFKVACEFDGRQHDKYPNYFHKSLDEYDYAQKNDTKKNKHAYDHKTILIRI
ncbi:MAG: hypothetical protein ACXACX_16850 [Candidatus Hodarchaeales archaeon]|jgi:hypothetical protein